MRGQPPAQRGALRPHRRPEHRRPRGDAGGRADRILQRTAARRTRHETRGPHPDRNPQPPAIPHRRGTGLSDARPAFIDPVGRREPAHQPLDLAGQQPHRLPLHPRRTPDRPASARHQPAYQGAQTTARSGQHGDRRRARGRGDPRRRLHRGHRSQGGLQRRRSGFQRYAGAASEKQKKPDGGLPDGPSRIPCRAAARSPRPPRNADGAVRSS